MCRISNFSNIPLIAVCIIAGAPLMAQVTTGTMVGTVKNRSGKVIANATIRITSPNLMSPRTLKSDEKGNWRAGFLPPGEYRVSFSMDGYQGRAIQDLRVGADTIVRADISLNTADVAGTTVEITGEGGATIDKSEAKVGYNYSADDLFSMPVTMDAHGAAFLTAGAVDDGSGYSLRGGMTNATMYRLDGVDIKNDYRGGVTGTGYLADLIQDIQVNLSPVHPRYGRSSGGALNVVTKNGSNTFSGTVRVSSLSRTNTWTATKATWPDADFESDRFDDTLRKDYHVTLLGPVIKDKLWFSFGARLTPGSVSSSRMNPLTNYQILHDGPMRFANTATASAAASPNAVALNEKLLEGPDGFHYPYSAFNVGEYYLVSNNRDFYQGKLTYSLTENHSLEYSISTEKTIAKNSSQYGGGENYIMASMLGNTITETTSWGIGYTGVYGSSTFVEARYNSYESNYDKPKYVHPLIKDPINVLFGNLSGGGGFSNDQWARAFTAHASHGGGELSGNKSW
ncbi:MAG: TonB-dependent receptor, partial [Holophagales bacterium]|nr:TonB-dependent receptor [Holophagales bacterium]